MAKNSLFLNKNESKIMIFGYHAVKAALKNDKRRVKCLTIVEDSWKIYKNEFQNKIDEIKVISRKEFNKIYNQEENNQGILLEAYNLPSVNLDEFLNQTKKNEKNIIVMLDQINSPQNIGSIIRSAALFGCKAIILNKKNSPSLNSTITKIASGGVEVVKYIQVTNLIRSIDKFKKNGYWVIGLDINQKKTIDNFEIPKKCLLIVGSENLGIRKLTKKNCDYLVSIKSEKDIKYDIDSLNVSNATAIALYEYFIKSN